MHSLNFNDLKGKKYGRLLAISFNKLNHSGNSMWLCKCDCKNEKIVCGSKLLNGHTKSCGCLRSSRNGLSNTRIYHIWRLMISRCEDYKSDSYYWYGFKGIAVCDEWHDFDRFYQWALLSGYKDNLSIDRIDSNGNYEPSNCRWISQKEQCNNVSSNHILTHQNKQYTISQFAELLGFNYWTIINRLRLGWDVKRIAETPEVKNER